MECLKLFNNACRQSFLDKERLFFEFEEFAIVLTLEFKDALTDNADDDIYHSNLKAFNDRFERLLNARFEVESFTVKGYEYLGWREDKEEFFSLSNQMYNLIASLNKFDRDIIIQYELALEHGDDYFYCGAEPNYIFQIEIRNSLIKNNSFCLFLIDNLKLAKFNPPTYYFNFYHECKPIRDSGLTSILNTNTKARRIGYLKLLSDLFLEMQKIPANRTANKFEDFAARYESDLLNHKNTKGLVVKSKTGNSAKPYLTLAKELNWLTEVNRISLSSKTMKVYQVLSKETENKERNPFDLSKLDKLFFLESFLKFDFIYLTSILEILFLDKANSYGTLIKVYQTFLMKRFNEFNEQLDTGKDSKQKKHIKTISERINSWKEADVYLEHVLMPRLNWLFDLDLIKFEEDSLVRLSPAGRKLFEHINYWTDINHSRIINPESFLKLFAVHLVDSIYYDNDKTNSFTMEEIIGKIITYLTESFEHFKTLAPNRVTSSQAITFTKSKLYLNDGIKVGFQFIENFLKDSNQKQFIYKYQTQYGDGYLQKMTTL